VNHPGAFAEFFTLPERNLHTLPDAIPNERAVFTEPLAAACEILDQVAIPCGETIAVLGDGKLGLLVALVLNAHGYPVRLYGRHPEKLQIAARVGVETAVSTPPAAEYAWVVEATGNPEGLRAAVRMTKPRGTVVLKSTVHGMAGIDTAPIVVDEMTLIGSRCGRFESALPLLDRDLIPVEEMISARFPLSQAPAAFDRAAEPGTLKVLLAASVDRAA
jgi:alcohol dehydrogenase